MNPDQLLPRLKALVQTLGVKQVTLLVVAFLGVVGVVVGSAYWMATPNYALLVSDMDAESAQSVISQLKTAKVSYQLDDGGRAIRVPSDKVDELRMQFASSGLPSAGRVGFEIFNRPAFGTTEFLEQVNYRRALEGELARTIATLNDVKSARVHISMPKDSIFADKADRNAKASVLLTLRNNQRPSAATIKGITGLIAGSVESLRPESVNILDTNGRPLTQTSDDGDEISGTVGLDHQQRIERDLSLRVVNLLEPIAGAGRVHVNVSASLKNDKEDQVEERWDNTPVIRSKQMTTESDVKAPGAQGAAGARANLPPNLSTSPTPPASAPVSPVSGPMTSRSSETTNYEISKSTTHRTSPSGQLARLSVAVILDEGHATAPPPAAAATTPPVPAAGDPATPAADPAAAAATPAPAPTAKPRTPEEMKRIQQLVATAVGFDEERGDQITVESFAFEQVPEEPVPPAPSGWASVGDEVRKFVHEQGMSTIRIISVAFLAVIVVFGVVRPMMRRALTMPVQTALPASPAMAGAAALPGHVPTVGELQGRLEGEATPGERSGPPALARRVAKLAGDDPEQVARVMRGWIAEEE